MGDIQFNVGNGALGRALPNKDHVSALCMPILDANLPAGFSTSDRIKIVFAIEDAEALGIVDTDSNLAHTHYQVSEFFRMQPEGKLYIYLYDSTTTDAAVYLQPVIEFPPDGEIRQAGVFVNVALATAERDKVQAVATAMIAVHRPFSALIGFSSFDAAFDWTAAPDLRAAGNENCSVVVAHDVNGVGGTLASGTDNIPALGAVLGSVAAAAVHQSIEWVDKFNFSDGTELETVALGNEAIISQDLSETLKTELENKGYIFMRKRIGINGTYVARSATNDLTTSDYANIENQRTIDKAKRDVRTFLLPQISSPVYLNEDGTLTEDTIQVFKSLAERPLDTMQQNGEVSAFQVVINPAQNVLATSEVILGIKIIPVGVARTITVNISFTLKITS